MWPRVYPAVIFLLPARFNITSTNLSFQTKRFFFHPAHAGWSARAVRNLVLTDPQAGSTPHPLGVSRSSFSFLVPV
jgi:hypothetical protein